MTNISGPNGKSRAQLCWIKDRGGGVLWKHMEIWLSRDAKLGEDSTDYVFQPSLPLDVVIWLESSEENEDGSDGCHFQITHLKESCLHFILLLHGRESQQLQLWRWRWLKTTWSFEPGSWNDLWEHSHPTNLDLSLQIVRMVRNKPRCSVSKLLLLGFSLSQPVHDIINSEWFYVKTNIDIASRVIWIWNFSSRYHKVIFPRHQFLGREEFSIWGISPSWNSM